MNFKFWKYWQTDEKLPLFIWLAITLPVLLVAVFYWYKGTELAYPIETILQAETIQTIPSQVNRLFYTLPVEVPAFAAFEKYAAAEPVLSQWPSWVLLGIVMLFLSLLFSVATFLNFNWFCVFTGTGAMWWVFAQPSVSWLSPGMQQWFGMTLAAIQFGVVWLQRQLADQWRFSSKWLANLLFLLLVAVALGFSNSGAGSLLVGVHLGMAFPMVVAFAFIVWTAADVLAWVFFQLSKSQPSRQAFGQYTLFSLIYLGNLALHYFTNTGDIQWDGFVVGSMPILLISTIVGFFFLEDKSVVYQQIVPFRPLGPVLYLAFAGVTYGVIGMHSIHANDPMLDVIDNTVTMVHGCVGLILFFYLLINYFDLLSKNLAVHRVMFQPRYMPVSGIYVAGLVGVFVLFNAQSRILQFQAYSGYYNGLADAHMLHGDTLLAREMYEAGKFHKHHNHKSNVALGMLDLRKGDIAGARLRFQDANERNASPQSYLALVQTYELTDKYFDQLFTLQQGMRRFPNQPALMNNLALMFSKTRLSDSARYYFEQLASLDPSGVGEGNFGFWLIKNQAYNEAATLFEKPASAQSDAWLANRQLIQLLQHEREYKPENLPQNVDFPALYNAALVMAAQGDTSLAPQLRAMLRNPAISDFKEEGRLALGYLLFFGGRKSEAFDQLNWVRQQGYKMPAYYAGLLGKLALIENEPETAAWYFSLAVEAGDVKAMIFQVLAETEAGNENVNIDLLNSVKSLEPSPADQALINLLISVNTLGFDSLEGDDAKELWLLLKGANLPAGQLLAKLNQISRDDVKVEAISLLARRITNQGDVSKANTILNQALQKAPENEALQMASFRNKASVLTLASAEEKLLFETNAKGYSDWAKGLKTWYVKDDKTNAISLLKTAQQQLPLEWPLVNNLVDALHEAGKPEDALALIADKVMEFPEHTRFMQKYCLQCARVGLPELAEKYVSRLSLKLSQFDYQQFEAEYRAIIQAKLAPF